MTSSEVRSSLENSLTQELRDLYKTAIEVIAEIDERVVAIEARQRAHNMHDGDCNSRPSLGLEEPCDCWHSKPEGEPT